MLFLTLGADAVEHGICPVQGKAFVLCKPVRQRICLCFFHVHGLPAAQAAQMQVPPAMLIIGITVICFRASRFYRTLDLPFLLQRGQIAVDGACTDLFPRQRVCDLSGGQRLIRMLREEVQQQFSLLCQVLSHP